MTRLTRVLLPASLCALLTSAIIAVACCHHGASGEPPAPVQTRYPGTGTPGERDAGSGASLTPAPPPRSGQPLSRAGDAEPEVQLASQPTVPLPGGTPSQPTVPPPVEPPPQPGVPLQPTRPPALPTEPGAPTRPTAPGTPITPISPGAPATPIGDAGIPDAYAPPIPPVPDAGIPGDSGIQPILRRD